MDKLESNKELQNICGSSSLFLVLTTVFVACNLLVGVCPVVGMLFSIGTLMASVGLSSDAGDYEYFSR